MGSLPGPPGTIDCELEVTRSTPTEFEVRNKRKRNNFVVAELVQGNQLSFIVENLPKNGTGCPGKWLFELLMQHFGTSVSAIQGNWTYGDNLTRVNELTAKGVSIEDAAKQTFTGKQAVAWGFSNVIIVSATSQSGVYTKAYVLFTK